MLRESETRATCTARGNMWGGSMAVGAGGGACRHTLPLVNRHFRRVCVEHSCVLWLGVAFPCCEVAQARPST